MTALTAAAFRDALARFASGVTVVTACGADGVDHGMTVSAFASLSLDPPLVVACVEGAATLLPPLRATGIFGVSILADHQAALSTRFAEHDAHKFDGVAVTRSASGPALLNGAVAQLVCTVVAEYPGGDHVIVVGHVREARTLGDRPLVYVLRQYANATPYPTPDARP
jgi:flavin reductase ActVB